MYIYEILLRQTCDINTEVCCTYKPKPTPVPTIPCASAGFDCVSPNQCVNGEISIKGYSQKVVSILNNFIDAINKRM